MSDERQPDHHGVLEWRVRALEAVENAIRAELHELRGQIARREEVYSRPETRELFVSRADLERQGAIRRQWPLIISALAMVLIGAANLIVTLGGH